MEERFEVRTYEVEYYCDECQHGKMIPTGKVFMTHPPKYEHTCDTCDLIKTFKKQYPVLMYDRQNVRFQTVI